MVAIMSGPAIDDVASVEVALKFAKVTVDVDTILPAASVARSIGVVLAWSVRSPHTLVFTNCDVEEAVMPLRSHSTVPVAFVVVAKLETRNHGHALLPEPHALP